MASTATKPLLTDLASTIDRVPSNFIRPIGDRPNLQQLHSTTSIPIIDLQGLDGSNRAQVIQNITDACTNYGFFQVHIKLYTIIINILLLLF